jgi:hypothetical protein
MAQFTALVQGVEVNGETVLAVIDALSTFKTQALNILAKSGINQPEAGKWYSQQAWLDSFCIISEQVGTATLFLIGKKIPENANFPSHIDNIVAGLQAIDVAYHMNHRLAGDPMFNPRTGRMMEGIGHYHFEKMAETKARMLCDNPYPCDFDRGIIEAMTTKFKPVNSLLVRVTHDNTAPCRKKGADACTYLVEW